MQSVRSSVAGARSSRADIARIIDSLQSVVQSLRIAGRAVEQQTGISSAQLYILEQLAERRSQSINELAHGTFTHQSSVSMAVSRLVESRLVSRTLTPGDARRLSISLTAAGRAVLKKAPNTPQTRLAEGLRRLDRDQLRNLADALATLDEILLETTGDGRGRQGSSLRREA